VERRELVKVLVGSLGSLLASPGSLGGVARAQPGASGATPPPVNLLEFEPLARQRLSPMAYEYVSQGAADEITLRANREAFAALRLKPRVLVDVGALDTRLQLFGQRLDFPILLAPAGGQRTIHASAEVETARGAHAAGALLVVSTLASSPIADIARAAPARLWFQLYVQRDRAKTLELIQRAEAAGCTALCVTVDTPVSPMRDREKRWSGRPPYTEQRSRTGERLSPIYLDRHDPSATWETIAWIRSVARVPVLLKGILAPEDARRAADEGLAGVIVSNHGGRNLDTTPATIEALPRVAAAVAGRITILLDGGVRRGTDVMKALALGARAVLIGRPYLWGLAVDGAAGVQRVVEILRAEFETTMALCGTPTLDRIDREVLWPGG
jgi:4-hydroxymandelate oxidase